MKIQNISRLLWGLYGVLTLYWIVRFWGHMPAFMDTLEYVFPEKWFNVESFRKGLIPLWNPYIACGTPHEANFQSAVFYPFFWLWNLTGLTDWFFVMAILHGVLAAAGFYLWMRAQKAGEIISTLCALTFGGSALVVYYWGYPTHLASLSWTPWVFLAALKTVQKPSWTWAGLLILFTSFQILAGYPYFILYTMVLLLAWTLFHQRVEIRTRYILGAALGAVLVLTACQWMPFLDYLGSSFREGGEGPVYSLRWVNDLTLLQPHILGIPGSPAYLGDQPNYIFNNLYLGLVPLGIFLWGLWTFRKYRNGFWKGSALFTLLWIAGPHFPLWNWLIPSKLLAKLEPSTAVFLFLFCACTSIGLQLREKAENTSKKNPIRKWAWVLGALWALDILFVPSRLIHLARDPYRDPKAVQAAAAARDMAGEGRILSMRSNNPPIPADARDFTDALVDSASKLTANTNVIWGLRSARGYLSLYLDGYQDLQSYFQKGFPYDGRILDAAGVKLLITPEPLSAFKYEISSRVGQSVFARNAGAMGTAWTAGLVREFTNRPEVFNGLLDPKAFLENEIYTQKAPEGGAVRLEPASRLLAENFSVSLWDQLKGFWRGFWDPRVILQGDRPSPCEAAYTVSTPQKGFLVFDEAFAPGWHAWVDGNPETIFRVYGYWMAVELAKTGDHRVVFRYEPTAFRLGLFLSLVSLMALATGLLLIKFGIPTPAYKTTRRGHSLQK